MTTTSLAPPATRKPLSARQLVLAFVSVVLVAIVPGTGLLLSVIYAFTVLREHKLARVLIVVLGVLTVVPVIFAWGPPVGMEFTSSTTVVGMGS